MKGNFCELTETEYQRLTEANTKAAFDYLEALIDHPEKIAEVPDGAIVVVPTEDEWVNQQNSVPFHWGVELTSSIALSN